MPTAPRTQTNGLSRIAVAKSKAAAADAARVPPQKAHGHPVMFLNQH